MITYEMPCIINFILFGSLVVHLSCSLAGTEQCGGSSRDRDNEICTYSLSSAFLGILNELKICHQQSTCACDACPQLSPRQLVDTPNSMALVPYMPTILSAFREETKTFHFAGRSVTIRQKWEELGVAAVVWDAAVVLAEYLEQNVGKLKLSLENKSVIELGAGTGLVGIVAALLGGHVDLTDRKIALNQLQANLEANIPESGVRSGISATVKELTWGENLQEFPKTYDLVLGADIVYLEDSFPDLIKTLVHVTNKDSLVLLSCRIRYARDENFLDMLREKFSVVEVLHEKIRKIHVFEAKLL